MFNLNNPAPNSNLAREVPDHIVIIGLGPSASTYFDLIKRLGSRKAYADEVWGINAIGDVLHCDRIFHMDDVLIQEARAARAPQSNIANMLTWLRNHPGPIYTSRARPGYRGLVEFPLQDVLNGNESGNGGAPYFNSTTAYAVAYAIHIGVKRISLYGIDYTLKNSHNAEKGRACVEFWLGIAAARGIEITIPETSSLMDACEEEMFYGYDCVNVSLEEKENGSLAVKFSDRDKIPSADEIEDRYDHSKHPNPLVKKG